MDEEYFLEQALFPHLDDPSGEETCEPPMGYFDDETTIETEEEEDMCKSFRVGVEDVRGIGFIECDECGCPLFRDDIAYDMTDGLGPVACSKKCVEGLNDAETERRRRMYPANGQTLSCFI